MHDVHYKWKNCSNVLICICKQCFSFLNNLVTISCLHWHFPCPKVFGSYPQKQKTEKILNISAYFAHAKCMSMHLPTHLSMLPKMKTAQQISYCCFLWKYKWGIAFIQICVYFQWQIWVMQGWLVQLVSRFVSWNVRFWYLHVLQLVIGKKR